MKRILAALGIVLGVGWVFALPAFASEKALTRAFVAPIRLNALAACHIGKEVERITLEIPALALSTGSHFDAIVAAASVERTPNLLVMSGWALAHREVWHKPDLVRGSGRALIVYSVIDDHSKETRPTSART